MELKKLSPEGIERALDKVERYRLLNEPWEAESICRDVLDADPDNHQARVSLVLALTDRFDQAEAPSMTEVTALIGRLDDAYERAYYGGIVCERKGTSILKRGLHGSGPLVWDWLRKAMAHYEDAEGLRPPGNDDALVRWNTCARIIDRYRHVRAPARDTRVTFLE